MRTRSYSLTEVPAAPGTQAWAIFEAGLIFMLVGYGLIAPESGCIIALLSSIVLLAVRFYYLPSVILQPRWITTLIILLLGILLFSLLIHPKFDTEDAFLIYAGVSSYAVTVNLTVLKKQAISYLPLILVLSGLALLVSAFLMGEPVSQGGRFSYISLWPVDEIINKNVLAGYLAPLIPLTIGLWKARWPTEVKAVVAGGSGFFLLIGLLFTRSEGAIGGLALSCTFTGMIAIFARFPRWRLHLVVLILPLVVFLTFAGRDALANRLRQRIPVWYISGQVIHENATTGTGVGNFINTFLEIAEREQYRNSARLTPAPGFTLEEWYDINHPHNLYLHLITEFGIPGGTIFISFLLLVALIAIWNAWKYQNSLHLALMAAYLTALLHGMIDMPLWAARPAPLLWILIGLIIGQYSLHEQKILREQPSKTVSLRNNFLWTLAGNGFYAATQWGILVAIARLGTQEMIGQFALGLTITAPVLMFTNLQLRAVYVTDAKNEFTAGDYLGLRLLTNLLAITIIFIFTLLNGYGRETTAVVLVIGIGKLFETVSDIFYGFLQRAERMNTIATSMILKGILTLATLAGSLYISGSIIPAVAGMAVIWFLMLLAYDIPQGIQSIKKWQPRWKFLMLRNLVQVTLPLGFTMMLMSLHSSIPRYFIEQYHGEAALGVFASISYLLVAIGMIVNALGQASIPRLSNFYATGQDEAFRELLLKLVMFCTGLGIAGLIVVMLAGQQILTLIYGEEYARYAQIFVWMMISGAFLSLGSILGYAATSLRNYHTFTIPYLIITIVSLGVSLLLIPAYGLTGAAWVSGITGFVTCLALIVILLRSQGASIRGRR